MIILQLILYKKVFEFLYKKLEFLEFLEEKGFEPPTFGL